MADAVSGGNGLFLMPKQFIADIGRATGGPQPILRAMAQAVDHLARIDNAAIVQEAIEPFRRATRAVVE